MNSLTNPDPQETLQTHSHQAPHKGQQKTGRHVCRGKSIQLVYAHLPPAVVLAMGKHLRAQTQIEQRAQEMWFAGRDHIQVSLNDWLRKEQEIVKRLCDVLLHGNMRKQY